MKIVKAMKKIARLKGEIRELKKRMSSCLNAVEGNDFSESYPLLQKELFSKIKELYNLKVMVMHTNVKEGLFSMVVNLGELKSYMEYLKELDPKIGMSDVNRYSDEKIAFKSQLSIKNKNKQISECQEAINQITDGLDDLNATIEMEPMEKNIILFE